ncbi:class I SAM-dependent methyltransferase [Eggerthellaceae bacterium zg-1084]|uniref:class I SAM-dependent methyltransferase n=1 Tax=Berryella wangjianweii TaxID=2734634 RepID=UPI001552E18B|nr:class I SAM-dependent methyltransferase [Berryella wangjianweii]NPD31312.1 class I SAM-dependent methyltransferase [Berryella wangjianweii]
MPTWPEGNPARPEGDAGRAMLARMNEGHHEVLAAWGLSLIDFAGVSRALDVGCGGGANLVRLRERMEGGHVTGLDYSELSVEVSRRTNAEAIAEGRCAVTQGDVAAMPFEDAAFNLVTGFETIYFWPDVRAGLAEALRVLAPGGQLLICNEADDTNESACELAASVDTMVVYAGEQLVCLFEGAGFEEVRWQRHPQTGHVAVVGRRPLSVR